MITTATTWTLIDDEDDRYAVTEIGGSRSLTDSPSVMSRSQFSTAKDFFEDPMSFANCEKKIEVHLEIPSNAFGITVAFTPAGVRLSSGPFVMIDEDTPEKITIEFLGDLIKFAQEALTHTRSQPTPPCQ